MRVAVKMLKGKTMLRPLIEQREYCLHRRVRVTGKSENVPDKVKSMSDLGVSQFKILKHLFHMIR